MPNTYDPHTILKLLKKRAIKDSSMEENERAAMIAAVEVVGAIVNAVERIADAVEAIEMNTRKGG
jgi:Mg2+ and Co2+ transporter CorA